MTKPWHDTENLGKILYAGLNVIKAKFNKESDPKAAAYLYSTMCSGVSQIVNLKEVYQTAERLDEIEAVLSYIPKNIMAQAVAKVHAGK